MSTPVDWQRYHAAIWRGRRQAWRPVTALDPVRLDDLMAVDRQKQRLVDNTRRFLAGEPCNHALLWGSRGTGKSSLVKAVLNDLAADGLRLVEVDRDDLHWLPDIVDELREQPFHFILFCDDLSFGDNTDDYRHLKSVLEGSIELPPPNVRLYATSNRRHLVPEFMDDNLQASNVGREIHHADAVEEKIALSDRFGLCLSFYPISEDDYFAIIDRLFPAVADRDRLHVLARRFSMEKGVRSGRTARQFHNQFSDSFT
jgi:hypothetical protein